MNKDKLIIDLRLQSCIKPKCWVVDDEVIVTWDGVMLVYPDFYGGYQWTRMNWNG